MKKNLSNQQGGFLSTIIVIIVALLIMKYFGWTITDAVNWFKTFFASVLK